MRRLNLASARIFSSVTKLFSRDSSFSSTFSASSWIALQSDSGLILPVILAVLPVRAAWDAEALLLAEGRTLRLPVGLHLRVLPVARLTVPLVLPLVAAAADD